MTYTHVTTMHHGLQAVAYGVPPHHRTAFTDGDDSTACDIACD